VNDPIRVPFALEAKRYKQGVNVGVKDMARLISRIKHREFGVLVTTSAVSPQTYEEVRQDKHPIVIVSGRDIAETLISEGINTIQKLDQWISKLDFERLNSAKNSN
jgi:uroporphyrinogen-III synthase